MSSSIKRQGKNEKPVKNLGWLLRHWKEVNGFTLAKLPDGGAWDAVMLAHLNDGGYFMSTWADASVMLQWVKRPVFSGLPGTTDDELVTVDLMADMDEGTGVRGNASATDDPAADAAIEDEIIRRLDAGDIWAWASVQVQATAGDKYKAVDCLGACSYADAREFMKWDDGYFCDMVRNVLFAIREQRLSSLG